MAKHIVVVGGGISGLSAAKSLLALGYRVTLLEKQNRIGGRIYSKIQHRKTGEVRDLSGNEALVSHPEWTVLEDGAAWIHYSGKDPRTGLPNPVKVMADELRIATVEQDPIAPQILDFNGEPVSLLGRAWAGIKMSRSGASNTLECSEIRKVVAKSSAQTVSFQNVIDSMVQDDNPDLDSCSVAQFLSSKIAAEKFCSFYIGGAALSDASAFPTLETFSGNDYFLIGGYNRITQHVFESIVHHPRFTIKMNTSATEIRQYNQSNEPTLVLTSNDEVLDCDAVVLAVPATLLQKATDKENAHKPFTFIPPLPQRKIDLIKGVHAGNMTKIHLHFAKSFWKPNCQYIMPLKQYRERGKDLPWFSIVAKPSHKSGEHTLTVCFYGEEAKFDSLDENAIGEFAKSTLKEVFGKAYTDPVSLHVGHRWYRDENACGAWCTIDASLTRNDIKEMGEPLGTLYFAGDLKACDTVHMSFISGQIVAHEILMSDQMKQDQDISTIYTNNTIIDLVTVHKKLAAFERAYFSETVTEEEKDTCKLHTLTLLRHFRLDPNTKAALCDLLDLLATVKSRQYQFIGDERVLPGNQGNTATYQKAVTLLVELIQKTMEKPEIKRSSPQLYQSARDALQTTQVGRFGQFAKGKKLGATDTLAPAVAKSYDDDDDNPVVYPK